MHRTLTALWLLGWRELLTMSALRLALELSELLAVAHWAWRTVGALRSAEEVPEYAAGDGRWRTVWTFWHCEPEVWSKLLSPTHGVWRLEVKKW
jgi:hypothetical protein